MGSFSCTSRTYLLSNHRPALISYLLAPNRASAETGLPPLHLPQLYQLSPFSLSPAFMLATAIKRNWRPWRPASLVFVGVVAYAITWRRGQWSKSAFLTTFSGAWLLMFAVWCVWMNQLYPKLFSPLRHLPGPKDNSFFNGQQARISKEPTGVPMVEWFNSIPNEGLIRYMSILNLERLAPTSAKALQEILVTKNYDFEKPADFRHTIGRILGVGILLAEGDEHKGQRRALNPAFSFRHVKDLVPVF